MANWTLIVPEPLGRTTPGVGTFLAFEAIVEEFNLVPGSSSGNTVPEIHKMFLVT